MSKTKRSAVGGRRSAKNDQAPAAERRAPVSVVIALGSNLGDRRWYLRRAIEELRRVMSVVRVSSIIETEPVDAPPPKFLNMVVVGHTRRSPEELLDALMAIEAGLGRRRTTRNAPRVIDLDLILHSAHVRRTARLTLPHPRYREREFVMGPLREVWRPLECGGLPPLSTRQLAAAASRG